jgi:hypothetical protein
MSKNATTLYIPSSPGEIRKLILPKQLLKVAVGTLVMLLLLACRGIYDILVLQSARTHARYVLLSISLWVLGVFATVIVAIVLQLLTKNSLLRSLILAGTSLILVGLYVRTVYPYLPHISRGGDPFPTHAFKRPLEAMALLIGLIGAMLGFFAGGLTNDEKAASQGWFRALYEKINASAWAQVPQLVSVSFLGWLRGLGRRITDSHTKYGGVYRYLAGLSLLFILVPLYLRIRGDLTGLEPAISGLVTNVLGSVGLTTGCLFLVLACSSTVVALKLSRSVTFGQLLVGLGFLLILLFSALLLWGHWQNLSSVLLRQVTGVSHSTKDAVLHLFFVYALTCIGYCLVLFRNSTSNPHVSFGISFTLAVLAAMVVFFVTLALAIAHPSVLNPGFLLFSYLFLRWGSRVMSRVASAALYALLVILAAATTFYLPLFASAGLTLCLAPFAVVTARERDCSKRLAVELNPLQQGRPFSLMVVGSFVLTLFSLSLGRVMTPSSPMPRSVQMFASNVLFDALTVVLTLWLLISSLRPARRLHPLLAIFLAIVSSGLFAIASLWLGVFHTDYHLTFRQVLVILVGRSLDGTHFELGPAFWTMHTTFIPTLLYLVLVLLAFVVKGMISLATSFLRRAQLHEVNPIRWISDVFLLISAIIGFVGVFLLG